MTGMAMAGDEVQQITLGEVSRGLARVEAAINALRGEVLTSQQWRAEREYIEHRLAEVATSAAEAKAAAVAEGAKATARADAVDKKVEDDRESSKAFKRIIAGAVVGVVLLWLGQAIVILINAAQGGA